MTPEQAQSILKEFQPIIDKVSDWLTNLLTAIREAVKSFVDGFKSAFITACLQSDEHKKKAQIYLRTKNRRIKRKQFKLLLHSVVNI
ncbi:hypothetical protein D3C78_1772120 [compost metagenome]